MNVLSTFDGMSCGLVALKRAGIKVDNYFASEIDKYAIQISKKNHPEIKHLGDVKKWHEWNLPRIDALLGGFPCQGFSNAGAGGGFEDPRSQLFFELMDIFNELKQRNPDLKFLFENVKMKKEWMDIITKHVGVEPIMINSALVSAQSRKRFYWTNIEGVKQPEDRHIYLKDIIEEGEVDREKSYCIDANYYKGGNPRSYFEDGRRQLVFEHQSQRRAMVRGAAIRNQITPRGVEEQLNIRKDEKSNCVVASYPHKLNGVVVKTIGHGYIDESIKEHEKYPSLCAQSPDSKHLILRNKSNSVRVGGKGSPPESKQCWDNIYKSKEDYRKLSPVECERLQTVEDNYTQGVSDTQRYKMLGNGWTVDVIAHIFSYLGE